MSGDTHEHEQEHAQAHERARVAAAGGGPEADKSPKTTFTVAEIDAALLSLPQLERDIYLNHRIGGLSYREIARQCRIDVGEVELVIARALFHLKCAFDEIARVRSLG